MTRAGGGLQVAARRTLVGAIALGLAAAPGCTSRGGGASRPVPVPAISVDPASTQPTDLAIVKALTRLKAVPDDDQARLALAQAYLQKVRETADVNLYTRAATLLDDLGRRRPDDPGVVATRGSLALSRHQFDAALALGHKAVALAPGNGAALAVVVDAANELGRYDEALQATDALAAARPDLRALSRVSYARELRGDLRGAIVAMTEATTAGAGSTPENLASTQVLLAQLLLTDGQRKEAGRTLAAAAALSPGLPAVAVGRARLAVALGHPDEAASLLQVAVDKVPLPEQAIALGDALTAAGRKADATEAYALVEAESKLQEANGVVVDLELALFQADHSPGAKAVDRARKGLKLRPSSYGYDIVAWSLFRAGKIKDAAAASAKALSLGSQDPQLRFHAAAIANANGDRQAATADLKIVLRTNPRFSAFLYPEVEALATNLGLEVPGA